jgi:ankyrin repeat protein
MPHLTRSVDEDIIRTARLIASAKGCVDVAPDLFSTQEDVDSRDSEGQTCLHLAVARNHLEMASFLIASKRQHNGHAEWTQICTSAHERVSQLLIEAGADVHILVDDIASPLYPIAAAELTDVRRLLQQGVNPSKKTLFHWSPLVRLISAELLFFTWDSANLTSLTALDCA